VRCLLRLMKVGNDGVMGSGQDIMGHTSGYLAFASIDETINVH
jgi:hypothetical protein